MKKHQYRVTVEYLADADGQPVDAAPLQFAAPNHDDIFAIVARMRERSTLSGDDAARFVVGLKLMSEAMLENKDDPLFVALKPHFGEFMKTLKQSR
jgi:hypothetical protein